MDLIERFRYIMKLNKLTASAFATQIGVQASSVSHVLSGRNKPSLEFIQKVLLAYPKIDSNWLINGTTKVPSQQESNVKKEVMVQEEKVLEVKDRPKVVASDSTLSKSIKKILVFYNDGTFEEFSPSF